MWDIMQPEDFDRVSDPDDVDALRRGVLVSADESEVAQRVAALAAAGADEVFLHHVGQDQSDFLARCAGSLLAAIRGLS